MTDSKPQADAEAPSDEEIAEAAARLSAKWGSTARAPETAGTPEEVAARDKPAAPQKQRTEIAGPIMQTLEKGRTHMVTVQVRKTRRRGPNGSAEKQD